MALTKPILPNNAMNFTENQHGNTLLEKLRSQRDSGRFCDVILHVQGKQFQAHRNVLAACSPYFDSILKMHKIVKEQLTITCQHHEVFQCLLNYMYTGNVVIDKNNVAELLRLANHFLVAKLKNYCAEYLDRYLDVTNCLSVREMAEKYNMPTLVKTATVFIQCHTSEVMQQNEILEYPLSKIETFLSDKSWTIPQDALLQFIIKWVQHNVLSRERDLRTLLTFVNWSALDRNFVVGQIDMEELFCENQRCLYFMLQSLEENSIHLQKYTAIYQELKGKFGQDDENVDNDSFMNIAISTAIEGFQEGNCSSIKEEDQTFDPVTVMALGKETSVATTKIDKEESEKKVSKLPTSSEKLSLPLKLRLGTLRTRTLAAAAARARKRKFAHPRRMFSSVQNARLIRNRRIKRKLKEESSEFDDDDEDEMNYENGDEDYDSAKIVKEGIKCPNCCYIAAGPTRLEHHIVKAHSKDVTYKCGMCTFTCKWNREYYMHMKRHFDGPPFICDMCDYSCERIQLILTHRMKHTDERPYNCEDCDYRCRTRTNLLAHQRCHTGERPYSCEECGRAFAIKSTLDQHLATHSDIRPFNCDTCGFSTKYQSHLIAHKRIHTGDVFRCQYPSCNYSSPKKSQLAAHMRTHMAVRSHVCSVCGRGFIEKSHLVRHERIHLNEKPFKCESCEYSSSRRDKLKEHCQKHHGEHATAKTPYKPRKPRRQAYDPSLYPGRNDAAQMSIDAGVPMIHPHAHMPPNHNQSLSSSESSVYSYEHQSHAHHPNIDLHHKSFMGDQRSLHEGLLQPSGISPKSQPPPPPTMVFDPRFHGNNAGLHLPPPPMDQRNPVMHNMNPQGPGNIPHSAADFASLSAFMALF